MTSDGTPPRLTPSLAWFARRHFRSLEDIEIVLLLWTSSERWWSPDEVAREIRSTSTICSDSLQRLCPALLDATTEPETYRFRAAADSHTLAAIASLDELYRVQRHEMIRFLAQLPSTGVRDFADAFRLKRDPKEEK